MRLIDLNPKWIVAGGRDGPPADRRGMGISFDCPCCRTEPAREGNHWARTGDTYSTLSVSPSIDASDQGHWHGCIMMGEVT